MDSKSSQGNRITRAKTLDISKIVQGKMLELPLNKRRGLGNREERGRDQFM